MIRDAHTCAPLGVLHPLLCVRPSLILVHILCTGSLPLPTFHAISTPPCIISRCMPARRRLPDPTPLAMCATKRAKTLPPGCFPSSSPTFPARTVSPHPCPRLTLPLHCTSARTLLYPRAPGHPSSKCGRVHDKSGSDFASRRAHDVAHSPHVSVLTWPILQPRPPPCAALNAWPRNVHASCIRR